MTRNSFKRKVIVFGIMIFASIALISTGFAAWIISQNAHEESENGNIQIGVVSDKNIEITDIEFKNDIKSFKFEPKEDDVTGRVRNDGENFECLSVTITGKIVNYDILSKLTVKLETPENVNLAAAISAGYIKLTTGDCINNAQEVTSFTPISESSDATFEYTITFDWGTVFGNMNPGLYYDQTPGGEDEDPTGGNVSIEEVKSTLNAFFKSVYGDVSSVVDSTFKIVLEATAN